MMNYIYLQHWNNNVSIFKAATDPINDGTKRRLLALAF